MRRVWLLAVVLALGVGCSGATQVKVSGPVGATVIGQASPVSVSGLGAGQRVTATMTSTDVLGVRWRSKTTLTADRQGRLSLDAADLIAAMTPLDPAPKGAYYWGAGDQAFRLQIVGASATVLRRFASHAVRHTPVTAPGLVGTFYSAGLPGRHSAVLLIGGSEGGEPGALLPDVLAGDGHPVLALAYFNAPGLPRTLTDIPLEYFATALRWLARQPGVDPARVVVDGASRGGEAALLIAATFPGLVHGVIAGVPSNVAVCSYPRCTGPAWTLHGKPIPYTRQSSNPHPTDNPRAVIQVERIDGPVLLNCGGLDNVWNSCAYAKAVMTRLARSKFPHQLEDCADCDHRVGQGVPAEPTARPPSTLYANDLRTYPRFFNATMTLLGA